MQTLRTIMDNVILKKMELVIPNANIDNKIDNVSVLDYEFDPELLDDVEYFRENELVISSLLVAKDNDQLLYDIVKQLIQDKVSGLAIKRVYYKQLPEKVRRLATRHSFPIFFFGYDLTFEDIIYEVSYEIRDGERNNYYEQMIDGIINETITNTKALELFDLNKRTKYLVFVFKIMDHDAYHEINKLAQGTKVYKYYNSAFIFIKEDKALTYYIDYFTNIMDDFDYYIGMTLLREDMAMSISNALSNLQVAYVTKRRLVTNKDEDFLHLLIKNYKKPEYQSFMQEYLDPILSDELMMETAIAYITATGDIKDSAKLLYVHENTIRYRINKLRQMLEESSSEFEFYKNLSLAVNIYNLNNTDFVF
ncbi:PucR family transcriptional regulator [Mycoplasma sp. P36-A1]|uniref:PucR family transcriptional regulator n=1 Tax=Mycoplasma sp. P36-A1 TaxID=3252900 RepID=UPI003C2FE31A